MNCELYRYLIQFQLALDDHPLLKQEDMAELVERTDMHLKDDSKNQGSMEDVLGIEEVLVKPSAKKKEVRDELALDYLDGEIQGPISIEKIWLEKQLEILF